LTQASSVLLAVCRLFGERSDQGSGRRIVQLRYTSSGNRCTCESQTGGRYHFDSPQAIFSSPTVPDIIAWAKRKSKPIDIRRH
jgi:hypothetical protein